MPLCLPQRRGMVGQPRGHLSPPDILEPCAKHILSKSEVLGVSDKTDVQPSAPSPGSLLFNDEEQSDVVLMVGSGPDVWRFPVHSDILSMASPVFQAMFGTTNGGICTESSTGTSDCFKFQPESIQVDIADIKPNIFQNLLKFVYTREVSISSVQNALNILRAADKYMVFDLVTICLDYLNEHVTVSNALVIYNYLCPCLKGANLGRPETCHENQNLQNELLLRCIDIIDVHAEQILFQDEFGNLDREMVHGILCRDTLQVRSELIVHKAIIMWACQECKRQRIELIDENKKNVLGKTLYAVRYLLMSSDEFVSGPGSVDLLTKSERDHLLYCIRGDQAEPLPLHLVDKKLGVKRTIIPDVPKSCPKPRLSLTCHRGEHSGGVRKKTVSKRVLQGLGDFVICVIQILD